MYAPLSVGPGIENLTLVELNEKEVKTLIPAIIYTCMLMTCGVIGNAVVIYVYCYRYKASNHRYFILTLGVCDFITSAVCMPFLVVDMLWPFTFSNFIVCKILRYITYNTALVSIFTLFFIAVERYRKICRPFQAQITLSLARRILFAIVLLTTTVFALPSVVLFGHSTIYTGIENTTGVACFIEDRFQNTFLPVAYNLTLLVVVFLLGVTMVYYYIKIAYQRILRTKTKPKRFKMNTVENSEYYLSSDQNEVQASALEGLKEEMCAGGNLRNTVTSWRAAEDVVVRFKTDSKQDVDKTNTSCNISLDKSLELIPDKDKCCYTSRENSNGSCRHQNKTKTCISLNERVEVLTHKKSTSYAPSEHLSKISGRKINNRDSNKPCDDQVQGPLATNSFGTCLSDHCVSNHKCLSASNVYYLTMFTLNGEDTPCIKQSTSCDTLFLESSSSCRDNTLAITAGSKSSLTITKNENTEETLLTHPIDKDNHSQTEVCDYTTHTFKSELGKLVMCETDQDCHIHDTAKGTAVHNRGYSNEVNDNALKTTKGTAVRNRGYSNEVNDNALKTTKGITVHNRGYTNEVNDNALKTTKGITVHNRGYPDEVNDNTIKRRKTKQNHHKKNNFIKRSFTKSAKSAELRDASVIRVTKMLFVITIVYFLSFIPHLVLMNIVLLDEHFLTSLDGLQAGIYYIGLRSFLINAVANPFVYNFMDKKFRKECKTLWYDKKTYI